MEWNEHTARTALRNRHRDKTPTTQISDLDLAMPKLRSGSFFPSLPERRIDQALFAVVMEVYVHRAPTLSVDEPAKAFGADRGTSRSEIPRSCADLW